MKFWIKTAFISFCLFFIFRYFSANQEELRLILNLKLTSCLLLFLIFLVIQFLGSYKHFIILKNLGLGSISIFEWFKIFITAKFINFHITQGANIYRGIKLKKKYDFPYTKSIGLISTFSWFEILAILILTILIIISSNNTSSTTFYNILTWLSVLTVLISVAPFLIKQLLSKLTVKGKRLIWIQSKLQELTCNVIEQIKNPRLVLIFFILSSLIYILNILTIMICISAININLNLAEISLFAATLRLSRILNIVPGNVGLTEIFCGYISELIGDSLGKGILISGILRIVEYCAVGIIALVLSGPIFMNKENN